VRLAVVGSQKISRGHAETAWVVIEGLIRMWSPDVVISGGATGIDSVAEAVAKGLGYVPLAPDGETPARCTGCPPEKWLQIFEPEVRQWDPLGQYGFKARNEDIAKTCDVLVRIVKKDDQTTYGSGWTADRAEELGKDVYRIYL
jgi:hypothetical protein